MWSTKDKDNSFVCFQVLLIIWEKIMSKGRKSIKIYILSNKVVCFAYVHFSALVLIFKLFKVGHFHPFRHLKICPIQTFPWFCWSADGQCVWMEVFPEMQLDTSTPTEILVKFAIPVGRAQLEQISDLTQEISCLYCFSVWQPAGKKFICHADRKLDINSPPKDHYRGHRPLECVLWHETGSLLPRKNSNSPEVLQNKRICENCCLMFETTELFILLFLPLLWLTSISAFP